MGHAVGKLDDDTKRKLEEHEKHMQKKIHKHTEEAAARAVLRERTSNSNMGRETSSSLDAAISLEGILHGRDTQQQRASAQITVATNVTQRNAFQQRDFSHGEASDNRETDESLLRISSGLSGEIEATGHMPPADNKSPSDDKSPSSLYSLGYLASPLSDLKIAVQEAKSMMTQHRR